MITAVLATTATLDPELTCRTIARTATNRWGGAVAGKTEVSCAICQPSLGVVLTRLNVVSAQDLDHLYVGLHEIDLLEEFLLVMLQFAHHRNVKSPLLPSGSSVAYRRIWWHVREDGINGSSP